MYTNMHKNKIYEPKIIDLLMFMCNIISDKL